MRIISLDIGKKSLGICISDVERIIAIPIENYLYKENDINSAIKRINEHINNFKNINLIIVGYPLKLNGKKGNITNYIETFLDVLKNNISKEINIKKIDERLTTIRGLKLLKTKYKNHEDLKKFKDLASSYVMLYDFLNS